MALRKHLSGAWIDKIEQYEFERIVILNLRKKIGNWKIILELFGEGNIILTDENNKILQAIIFKKMRDRNIIRNELYQFPPSISRNPFKIQEEELKNELINLGKMEIIRAIMAMIKVTIDISLYPLFLVLPVMIYSSGFFSPASALTFRFLRE